jgi:hypothetical protein
MPRATLSIEKKAQSHFPKLDQVIGLKAALRAPPPIDDNAVLCSQITNYELSRAGPVKQSVVSMHRLVRNTKVVVLVTSYAQRGG